MHYMGKSLHLHQLHHLHALILTDPTQIVSRQIHQHDVFRPLFGVRLHLFFISQILLRRLSPRPRARNRSDLHLPIFTTHMGLRRRADKGQSRHLQTEHIGRRVDRPKSPVQIDRPSIKRNGEPLGGDHLKDVPCPDVFLHPFGHLDVLCLAHVGNRSKQ